MLTERILSDVITSQYRNAFCIDGRFGSKEAAMVVKFSLSANHDVEEGYRNLEILIFGDGSNYISVFARTDWNVRPNDDESYNYTKGKTPWVLYGCHDSCWVDAVANILRDFSNRICTIDHLFATDGWYSHKLITEEEAKELAAIRRGTPGYGGEGKRVKVEDLEFQFAGAR